MGGPGVCVAQVSGIQPRPADAGSLAVDRALRNSVLDTLMLQLEAERDRWFLWLPVLFGSGIAFYFALPSEPGLMLGMLPTVAALALRLAGPRTGFSGILTAVAL